MTTIKGNERITLSGLGDLVEKDEYENVKNAAEKNGLSFRPTYYDHELTGNADDVEKATQELWNMGRDEWQDNGFQVTREESTWETRIVANGETGYYGRLTDEQIKKVVEFADSLVSNEA